MSDRIPADRAKIVLHTETTTGFIGDVAFANVEPRSFELAAMPTRHTFSMNPPFCSVRQLARRFLSGLAALCLALIPTACREKQDPELFQGYLEAEYVYVASPYGGALRELQVSRGDEVKPGQPLFALDPEPEVLSLQEAQEKLRKSESLLADLRKGSRPSEIDALEARRQSTATELQLAEQLLKRREQANSANAGTIPAQELDESRSRVAAFRSDIARVNAELETARLGAREDQIRAGDADV